MACSSCAATSISTGPAVAVDGRGGLDGTARPARRCRPGTRRATGRSPPARATSRAASSIAFRRGPRARRRCRRSARRAPAQPALDAPWTWASTRSGNCCNRLRVTICCCVARLQRAPSVIVASRSSSRAITSASVLERCNAVELDCDRQPVPLARFALTARLHGKELRHAVGDRDEIGRVVEHEKSGGTEPAAGRRQRFIGGRRVEHRLGQERIGNARQGRHEPLARPRSATDLVDDLPDRCPERHLADAVPSGIAAHRADDGPRRFVGAERSEPGRALHHDPRHVRQRLDVVGEHETLVLIPRFLVHAVRRGAECRGGTAARSSGTVDDLRRLRAGRSPHRRGTRSARARRRPPRCRAILLLAVRRSPTRSGDAHGRRTASTRRRFDPRPPRWRRSTHPRGRGRGCGAAALGP